MSHFGGGDRATGRPVLTALSGPGPLGLAVFGTDLRITEVNEAVADLHGIPPGEHRGCRLLDLNPAMGAIVEPLLRRVAQTGEPITNIDLTTSVPVGSGRPYRALASLKPLRDDDGRPGGVAALWWEVTDRSEPDLVLGDAERRFRSMADAAPVLIWLSADDGRRTWVNQRWTEWTGRDLAEESGRGWVEGVHPDDRQRVEQSMRDAPWEASADHPHEIVYRLRRADGSYGWLLQRAVPRPTRTGLPAGMVGACTDITEIQELQSRVVDTHDRLERLQRLTQALSGATTTADVVAAMLEHGITAVGARAGAAVELDDDGGTLRLVDARGYEPRLIEALRELSLDADVPLALAARTGRRVHYASTEAMLADLPRLAEHVPVDRDVAVAAMPLATNAGVVGALSVSFDQPTAFAPEELALLDTVAAQSAQAFERARLYEREAQARARAEAASERVQFLVRASDVLSSSLDVRKTLQSLARVSVPHLADWCLIYLLDRQGAASVVVAEHRDPARSEELGELAQRRPVAAGARSGIGLTLSTGRSQLLTDLAGAADDHIRGLAEIGGSAAAIVPIEDVSGVIGAMAFVAEPERRTAPEDFELAQELARRAGTAVTNALAYEERTRIARGLQKRLMPVRLPEVPGVDLAASYVPCGLGLDVGGDFYDAFRAADGRWVLAIGDVRGRGVAAAAVTGTARVALRSAARHDTSPRSMLAHLNAILLEQERETEEPPLPVPRFCTVGLAVLEPDGAGAVATLCCAGHPLPTLVRPGEGVRDIGEPGMLLGVVEEPELPERRIRLEPGDALVFVTDGILERRDGDRFFEDDLAGVLADCAGATAEEIATRVEKAGNAFGSSSADDDMAVLVARVPSTGGHG